MGWEGMEDPDSKDATDAKAGGASAENSESPASSSTGETSSESTSARPSAIERQIAAASGFGYGHQTHQEARGRTTHRRKATRYARRHRPYRFFVVGLLVLLFLIAMGLVLLFIEPGSPLQNAANAVLQKVEQTAAIQNASPVSTPQTDAPTEVAEVAPPSAISVPIADVSLRNRPELLEQLVQVYRSQLADNPHDSAALAALNRLQQRSLSELETIMAAEDQPTSVRSLEVVARLFPELEDNPRYEYLAGRMGRIHREAKTAPPAEPEHSTPLTTAIPSAPISPVSTPADSSAGIVKNHVRNTSPPKPIIRVLSVTPGAMVAQRFVPYDEDGNVLMVEISYRNFESSEDQSDVTLIARLGIPGDSAVLAEVPIEISGGRGTKTFLMETLVPGNAGEKYRLNFMLDDKLIASPAVRLSAPKP